MLADEVAIAHRAGSTISGTWRLNAAREGAASGSSTGLDYRHSTAWGRASERIALAGYASIQAFYVWVRHGLRMVPFWDAAAASVRIDRLR
jgi:hypothetical protein